MENAEGLSWRKSSFSGNGGPDCVEVGTTASGQAAGLRDSKSPERGHLAVSAEMFAALLVSVKRGELDL